MAALIHATPTFLKIFKRHQYLPGIDTSADGAFFF